MGYSPLIEMIHTLLLYDVVIWWPAGEFVIASRIYGMVNSSSFNKLKPIFFPEGDNSGSYVIIVVWLHRKME